MLLGHTKQINGVWKIQSLKQHSENVAEYCARVCQPLGLENLGHGSERKRNHPCCIFRAYPSCKTCRYAIDELGGLADALGYLYKEIEK